MAARRLPPQSQGGDDAEDEHPLLVLAGHDHAPEATSQSER
jgi:hypothetical protein